MSVYWPAGHHTVADDQRDRQRLHGLNIVAAHARPLGRNTCVAWSIFTSLWPDWTGRIYSADSPESVFFEVFGVYLQIRCKDIG
jgi:hypothetical protein